MPQQSVAPTSTSVTTSPASPNDDPSENMITSSYGVLHNTVRKMNISNLLFYTIYTYSILLIINQYYRLTWSSIMMIKQDYGRWGIYIYIVLHIKSIVMYLKKNDAIDHCIFSYYSVICVWEHVFGKVIWSNILHIARESRIIFHAKGVTKSVTHSQQ